MLWNKSFDLDLPIGLNDTSHKTFIILLIKGYWIILFLKIHILYFNFSKYSFK